MVYLEISISCNAVQEVRTISDALTRSTPAPHTLVFGTQYTYMKVDGRIIYGTDLAAT